MKKFIRRLLIFICVICLAFTGFQIYQYLNEFNKEDVDDAKLIAEITSSEQSAKSEDEEFTPDASTYGKLHSINSDYRGWLKWDSNMISTPIMQNPSDDAYYLKHNIYKNVVIGGGAFIESDASLDDQNLTVYGHSVFYTNTQTTGQMFSRLRNLETQTGYENNKGFKIYWENDISVYEVYAVCEIDESTNTWSFERKNFTDSEFQDWISNANNKNLIKPSIIADSGSKYVTFQTCKYREGSERIIVIGKEIERINY
jgi:sortase B